MEDKLKPLWTLSDQPVANLVHAIDILLVTYLIFRILSLIKGTRSWRLLGGIITFILALYFSNVLQLTTLHWLLDRATLLAPVALVILLLPELRQALEGFGKLGLWPQRFGVLESETEAQSVEEIVAAATEMSAARVGALIVVERGANLDEIIGNGVRLDARISAPLLNAIFYAGNPLHDGAVVVRGDRVVAAACRLPLSESARLDAVLHMRHRAAVGVTEALDCIAVVVSEERGSISVAIEGKLRRLGSHIELREFLNAEVRGGQRFDHPKRPRAIPYRRPRR